MRKCWVNGRKNDETAQATNEHLKEITEAFNDLDVNADGLIDVEDLKKALSDAGQQYTSEQVRAEHNSDHLGLEPSIWRIFASLSGANRK